jgi:peptide/nickel transport system substrate-binding protein
MVKPTVPRIPSRLLPIVVAVVLVASACTTGAPSSPAPIGTGTPAATGTIETATPPSGGGTLTFARSQDSFTWDIPAILDDPSIFTSLQVYDRLVKLGADGKTVEPELATEWTVADDGLSAEFKIRQGVKFSDGTPLTMDDVVFSLERDLDPAGNWGFLFTPVTGVEAVDEETVRITMSSRFTPLLLALSTFAAGITSKANVEEWGDQIGDHPLGTGAFFLEQWDRGNQIVLTKNPHYWQTGKPSLDQIVMKVVGDDNARVLQLQSGEVDVIDHVPTSLVESLSGGETQVQRVDGTSLRWLLMNLKVKPFDEQAVRCAMAYSFDREAIANNADQGVATVAKSILPENTAYYTDANPIGYDLDKARSLLSESSVATGFDFETYVAAGDSGALTTAQIWADSLKQLNVNVTVEQVEATTLQQFQNSGNFTTAVKYWTNDTPDPDEQVGAYATLGIGLEDPELEARVVAAREEADPAAREELYHALQQEMNEQCYIAYIVNLPRLYATTSKVKGFAPNSQGKYGFEDVTLEP